MTRTSARAGLAAIIVLVTLAGCGPDGKPVARVGHRTITVADFMRAAHGNELQYPAPAEQAKTALLEDLVRRELMLVAVHDRGLDTNSFARNFRRTTEERILMQSLYEQMSPRDPGVSEGEARAFYAFRDHQAETAIIFANEETMIRSAAAALARGEPFEQVANQVNIPGVVPPGGMLGLVTPGSLLPPLDEALRTQPLGAIGGPYETPQGWFLMRVTRRVPNPQQPFEVIEPQLVDMVRQRKQRHALTEGLVKLREEYHLSIPPAGGVRLFQILTPYRVAGMPEQLPTAAERATNIATWDGGHYTLGQAFDDLRDGSGKKPASSILPAIQAWIEGQAMSRIAIAEARRRHLGEEPLVAAKIRQEIERAQLEAEYANAVGDPAPPDEAALRAAWDQLGAGSTQLTHADFQWIEVPDSATARAIGLHGGHGGGTLADAAKMADPALVAHEESVDYPATDPRWNQLRDVFTRMAPREWAGPVRTAGGWQLLQLIAKTQAPLTYDQLTPAMKQNLFTRLAQNTRDLRFTAYSESLRAVIHPVMLPENLRAVPWPVPAPLDVGQ